MAHQSDESAPPLFKRRKLSSIFSNKLVAKAPVFDELEDVTFIVGNKETGIEHIGGNRTVFAVQSDVFQAQLFGKMEEGKKDEIIIEDVTPAAFTFLKNLFYVKDQQLTVDIVLDVLYASKKYLLFELECECYKFIETVKNLDDWWKLISKQTITTDVDMDDALIRKSQILINNSNKIVKDSEKLCQLTPQWLAKLVQSSSFMIDDETIIWEMCIKYCQHKISIIGQGCRDEEKSGCDETSMVANMMNKYFVKHIRFALMNKNYFFTKIEKSGILNDKIMYNICKCCLFDDAENLNNKYNSGYCWYPRKPYDQFFLARYDIRMLSTGDRVVARSSDGSYVMVEIDNIDWTSTEHLAFGKNGIIFGEFPGSHFYKFWTVDMMQQEWRLASSDSLAFKHPTNQQINVVFKNKMKVEYRLQPTVPEWVKGEIVSIEHPSGYGWRMISVSEIVDPPEQTRQHICFHPWSFHLLRPMQGEK